MFSGEAFLNYLNDMVFPEKGIKINLYQLLLN
jgi:hypothetical protein